MANSGEAWETARRFLRYLELSYQVLVLQPYHRNPHKRLVKMPKILGAPEPPLPGPLDWPPTLAQPCESSR